MDGEVESVGPVWGSEDLPTWSLSASSTVGRRRGINGHHVTAGLDVECIVSPHARLAQVAQDIERVGLLVVK